MLDFDIGEFPLKWRYGDGIKLKEEISLESIILESERIREMSRDLIVYRKDIRYMVYYIFKNIKHY